MQMRSSQNQLLNTDLVVFWTSVSVFLTHEESYARIIFGKRLGCADVLLSKHVKWKHKLFAIFYLIFNFNEFNISKDKLKFETLVNSSESMPYKGSASYIDGLFFQLLF